MLCDPDVVDRCSTDPNGLLMFFAIGSGPAAPMRLDAGDAPAVAPPGPPPDDVDPDPEPDDSDDTLEKPFTARMAWTDGR